MKMKSPSELRLRGLLKGRRQPLEHATVSDARCEGENLKSVSRPPPRLAHLHRHGLKHSIRHLRQPTVPQSFLHNSFTALAISRTKQTSPFRSRLFSYSSTSLSPSLSLSVSFFHHARPDLDILTSPPRQTRCHHLSLPAPRTLPHRPRQHLRTHQP